MVFRETERIYIILHFILSWLRRDPDACRDESRAFIFHFDFLILHFYVRPL